MYEGVTIPCGLKVKNGQIVTEPQFDQQAIKERIKALQVKQPWTIAKERAREEAQMKKRK
jgi:CRISPR/Cas system-associated protein Csm6